MRNRDFNCDSCKMVVIACREKFWDITGDEGGIPKRNGDRIGHIQEFDPEKEKVSADLESVQMFLVANSIEAEMKFPVLLLVIGGKTYTLLGSLLAPEKPKGKTFEQLPDVLQKYFEPKPVVIVQRFHFHRRN